MFDLGGAVRAAKPLHGVNALLAWGMAVRSLAIGRFARRSGMVMAVAAVMAVVGMRVRLVRMRVLVSAAAGRAAGCRRGLP